MDDDMNEDAHARHGMLAELSERAQALPGWRFVTGMAINRSAEDILFDVPHRRIVQLTADGFTVLCPETGLQALQGVYDPVVDLSDPVTFGFLLGLCKRLDDYECDRIYELFDCGNLAASANVILDVFEDTLPF
tara:strand:+ start:3486 stop:3887 length:402 start_codon:yes stop_codon:yes gene_type:complete